MLKRVLSISLLIIYSTVICGFKVNLHYCGGTIASVGLSILEPQNKCECGTKEMKRDCCENKSVNFQFKVNQEVQYISTLNITNAGNELVLPYFINLNIFTPDLSEIYKADVTHRPPIIASSNPIYLLNRVFRI